MDTIGRLTGGVAHDFNNLLMAVLGSLALLEKKLPEDPQIRRLLQIGVDGVVEHREMSPLRREEDAIIQQLLDAVYRLAASARNRRASACTFPARSQHGSFQKRRRKETALRWSRRFCLP